MPQTPTSDWHQVKDTSLLATMATQAAITSNWSEAAKINEKILNLVKNDIEALNRLARALLCLGQRQKAIRLYKKALEIDPYNIIARKNLDKLSKSLDNGSAQAYIPNTVDLSTIFLFEPGKTKIVNLFNVASPNILACLNCGDQLNINPKNHAVTITGTDGNYLGALPDDLAHRLLTFIAGGNKYEAYVKSATTKTLTIFIREISRSERFINQPSFQNNLTPFLD